MDRKLLLSIIAGYENQLSNTSDPLKKEWLNEQISAGLRVLATEVLYA